MKIGKFLQSLKYTQIMMQPHKGFDLIVKKDIVALCLDRMPELTR